jgi:SAM-dependent methyltransferase
MARSSARAALRSELIAVAGHAEGDSTGYNRTGMKATDWEKRQAKHYDEIASAYEEHYSDEWSQRYRRVFINDALTEGIDLAGSNVLDAMCGSGQLAGYLEAKGARVTGIDISSEVIELFKAKLPQTPAIERSILATGLDEGSFDAVIVVGGLHHVHPDVDRAVDEIHRILKPGGYFCFAEPHVGSMPNAARRLWYWLDPLFEANEAGIDPAHMQRANAHRFEFVRTRYTGALAYLLVYNSMVFRVPRSVKRLYSPLLLRIEKPIQRIQGRRTSCMVVCTWRKKPALATALG